MDTTKKIELLNKQIQDAQWSIEFYTKEMEKVIYQKEIAENELGRINNLGYHSN